MITYCPRCGAESAAAQRAAELLALELKCADCGLTMGDAPAMLAAGNTHDEVEYDLGEWEVSERGSATAALVEADIPYRWEANLVLVVPDVAEVEVDRLLDELEEVDELEEAEDDDGIDGGEEAQGAMADLFVAADRLQHDPADPELAAHLLRAEAIVGASLPPYGIDRPVWRRIQALASTVATDLEEVVDEDTVAADARALREYLRDLV